ncbi:MAG TPA: dihydroorotase [Candidatus Limnocylindrales bacterium]|nr:dihydroorotase [Candidatus Limnocylindrales bacterium]
MATGRTVIAPEAVGTTGAPLDLELTDAWAIDPATGRSGPADLVVQAGRLESIVWRDEGRGARNRVPAVVVAPGFIDLHAHLREPGGEEAETIATGLAAAAHGGFTTVCAMPNTNPPIDDPAVLAWLETASARAGSPVLLRPYACVSLRRAGETLAPLGALADAGAVAFSDDGSPVASPGLLRSALLYAAELARVVVDHPEDRALTEGAEANDDLVGTVLGLPGWPAAAEVAAVERDLAVLADVVRDARNARLHLTHVSTRGALDAIRRAKARGLPVTCDITPHHLSLADEWLAGARRWAWEAIDADGRSRDPWRDEALVAPPFDTSLRVNPPLRSAEDAVACLAALADGTVDAVATDHAPHGAVAKEVEFGAAANGIIGLETTLGTLLEAVATGRLTLERAIAALTAGPASVLGRALDRSPGLIEGEPADFVVFDRSSSWRVSEATLRSRSRNTPLLGRDLPGRVLLTVADGRLAYAAS